VNARQPSAPINPSEAHGGAGPRVQATGAGELPTVIGVPASSVRFALSSAPTKGPLAPGEAEAPASPCLRLGSRRSGTLRRIARRPLCSRDERFEPGWKDAGRRRLSRRARVEALRSALVEMPAGPLVGEETKSPMIVQSPSRWSSRACSRHPSDRNYCELRLLTAHMRGMRTLSAVGVVVSLLFVLAGMSIVGAPRAVAQTVLSLSQPLWRVSCPSISQCTAIDTGGREFTFDPLNPDTPSPTTIDPAGELFTLACPSTSQCATLDEAGSEVAFDPAAPGNSSPTSIDSTGGFRELACPSASQCTAIDRSGAEVTFDPLSPRPSSPIAMQPPGEHERGAALACPTSSQCTAVDPSGREFTFNPLVAGTTTTGVVDHASFCGHDCPEGYVNAVACPSIRQCTAVDNASREVTFDPTAPGSPTVTYIHEYPVIYPTNGFTAVVCPSIRQCTAIDAEHEVTFDPTAPGSPTTAMIDSTGSLSSLSCPSPAQCTAVDGYGGVEVTFDPNSPASATRAVVESPGPGSGPSSPGSSPPPPGMAQAVGSARVTHGVAAIKIRCTGSGPCHGTIDIVARIVNRHVVSSHGRRHVIRRAQAIVIGKTAFSLARNTTRVTHVSLSRRGAALVLRAGRRGLTVRISGSDLKPRSLALKGIRRGSI
jgi:hypothetical protein